MLQLASFESAPEPDRAAISPAVIERGRALGEQQLQMLTTLAEIGLDLAAETARRVKCDPDADGAGHAMAYSRIARAVRLTIALQSKVMAELIALDEAETNGIRAREADAEAAGRRRVDARAHRVERIVHRIVDAEIDDEDAADRLCGDAWERLVDDDIYGDLSDRPIGEIVALICRDLGLSPDWSRWAGEAWAEAEAEAAPPSSPFAACAAAAVAELATLGPLTRAASP